MGFGCYKGVYGISIFPDGESPEVPAWKVRLEGVSNQALHFLHLICHTQTHCDWNRNLAVIGTKNWPREFPKAFVFNSTLPPSFFELEPYHGRKCNWEAQNGHGCELTLQQRMFGETYHPNSIMHGLRADLAFEPVS